MVKSARTHRRTDQTPEGIKSLNITSEVNPQVYKTDKRISGTEILVCQMLKNIYHTRIWSKVNLIKGPILNSYFES